MKRKNWQIRILSSHKNPHPCVIRRFNSSVLRNVQYRIVTLWFPPFFLQNVLKKRAATSIFLGTVARVVSQQFNKNLFVPGKNRWTERAESSRFSIVLCLGSATGEQRWKTKKKSLGSAKRKMVFGRRPLGISRLPAFSIAVSYFLRLSDHSIYIVTVIDSANRVLREQRWIFACD